MPETRDIINEIESRLQRGLIFDAYNMCKRALKQDEDSLRINQLFALILAKLGVTDQSLSIIQKLYNEGHSDPETSGILARIHKDIHKASKNSDHAQQSRDIYLQSFNDTGEYYPGINAASMSLVLGEIKKAKSIAKQVIKSIDKNNLDYWSLATLGEAFLITEDFSKSNDYYIQAIAQESEKKGNISSTFEQLLFLSNFINIPEEIFNTLRPPAVVVFSGHMIDSSIREKPRFPDEIKDKVKAKIAKELDDLNAGIGYCSAACGADILFIEAMLERGAEVNVYLPFAIEDFIETSIAFAGPDWIIRFHRIMLRVNVRYITEESYLGNDDLFQLLGKVIMGLTQLTAQLLSSEAYFLGVLEDQDDIKIGGSADLLKIWERKKHVRIINPIELISEDDIIKKNIKNRVPSHISSEIPFGVKRLLKCILFADIVGFSKMEEEHTPFYMFELLETLSQNLKKLKQPEILNTWGDAIFAVFDEPKDCMEFAEKLNYTLLNTDWSTRNLPSSINIRIALHTGPVFVGDDPITGKLNAYGTHINRTARIEPVTVPGCIYCSEQFAALLLVHSDDKYTYRYIGVLELPKGFGTQEIYQINSQLT